MRNRPASMSRTPHLDALCEMCVPTEGTHPLTRIWQRLLPTSCPASYPQQFLPERATIVQDFHLWISPPEEAYHIRHLAGAPLARTAQPPHLPLEKPSPAAAGKPARVDAGRTGSAPGGAHRHRGRAGGSAGGSDRAPVAAVMEATPRWYISLPHDDPWPRPLTSCRSSTSAGAWSTRPARASLGAAVRVSPACW